MAARPLPAQPDRRPPPQIPRRLPYAEQTILLNDAILRPVTPPPNWQIGQTVEYTVFIQSPNDKLVGEHSLFWLESGISIETTGSGIQRALRSG